MNPSPPKAYYEGQQLGLYTGFSDVSFSLRPFDPPPKAT